MLKQKRENFEMKKLVVVSLILVLGFMLGVGIAVADEGVHWGYEGEHGPEHWGALSHDYAACSEGREQSPIDVPATAPIHSADIVFNYQPTALNIVNNGHTIKVDYDVGSSMTVEGKTYNLLQFHFHSLSEHTFHGGYYDMEMHLVHQSDDGEYAVVGVMLERSAENAAYAPVWDHMPTVEGEPETISGVTVNAEDLLPGEQTYYRYNGSFTTPPCTEGVKWFVMNTSVGLSDAQVDAFRQIYTGNYRPVQSLNERVFNPAVESAAPITLPVSGGAASLLESVLAGLGVLATVAGLYLRRRKTA
jgi:carbonic anhydrase